MRFARGMCSALCGCLAVVGQARVASADAHGAVKFGFDYQAEPDLGCPTATELRTALAQRLEYDPFAIEGSTPEYRVRIVLTKLGAGLEARIDWLDEQGQSEGERRLASETGDCSALARGVVFAVAVQIQLRASSAPATAEPAARPAEATPVAARAPAAAPAREPVPVRAVPTSRLLLVGAGAGLERGWLPETAVAFNVVGAVSLGRGWLEAGVGVTTLTNHELPDGTGFDARTLSGWLSPCVRTPPFGWCATGMVGRLYVRGRGVDHALSPSATLTAIGGKVELLWPPLQNFGVLIHAQALATLAPSDVIINRAKAWATAPVLVAGGVDLAAIFR
jgi:hypothetical protein